MEVAGVQNAIVVDNKDPDQMGRVLVRFPWDTMQTSSSWARVVQSLAGNNYGFYFLPEIGDEVLVAFSNNNHDYPVVIGSLYNGSGKQADCYDSNNYIKNIKTKAGNEININDKPGEETILITNPQAKNYITLNMKDDGQITIESTNGVINLIAKKINLQSQEDTTIKCKNMTVDASGGFEAKAATGMHLQSSENLIAEAQTECDIKSSGGNVAISGLNVNINANIGATVKGNATAEISASGETTVKGGIVMIN